MATSVHSATVGDTNALGENITPDHGSDRDMNSEPQTKGALPDDTAWRFPTADEILQELSQEFTSEEKERVWTEASDAVKAYYDRLLVRWKEEMDTLLVYAGVSSAVMTAFIVESYKLLQPDPTDVTVAVLKQISTQLNSFTISPPFVNVTQVDQSASATHAPFRAPSSAIWLNALWFSSLVFSLGSALLALFVKQWIYEATVGGNSRESARLRQHRLNGLLQWRVGTIVVVLPIMLQLASILFLGGLVLLLWTLHAAVATVASLLVGILFTFFLTVTILPVFRSDCSYRSPASLAIYVILRHIRNTTMENIRRICKVLDRWYAALRLRCGSPKVSFLHQFAYNRRYLSTWRGRDQNDIHNQLGAIDRAILTTAYSTTIDTKFVSDMPVVFSDLPPHEVTRCFVDICNFMEGEWGDRGIQQRLLDDPTTLPRISCYGLRHILARPDKGTKAWVDDIAKIFRYYTLGREPTERFVEFAFKTLCQLAVESLTYKTIYGSAYVVLSRFYDQQKAHHTYDTLCHVRMMAESVLVSWDHSRGFEELQFHTTAIFALLHGVRHVVSAQSQLTPSQTEELLEWGRGRLSYLVRWLRNLEWQGLHKGCVTISADGICAMTFPHIASNYLITDVIDPLIALCSTPEGLELVSEELIFAVEHAWSSVQAAYPNPIDIVQGEEFVWCSGLDSIDAKLTELRATYTKASK